jgi:CHAD domain-containing protein
MSFELRKGESIRKSIHRVARMQLRDALESLQESRVESVDERIHSVRKSFKRVRAVLRLVRYSFGESTYRFENESLRDAARPLSEVRDAKILIEALDKLRKKHQNVENAAFEQARNQLIAHQRDVHKKVLEDENAFAATSTAIEEALERLDQWSDQRMTWSDLCKGVKRVYRSGRNALDDAKSEASNENLHELRKQAKYLRHQLELLTPTWPKVVGELATQAEELGDVLGEDHDLAVLCSILTKSKGSNHQAEQMKQLAALIGRQRGKLQEGALPKAELLYRDRPKQFVHRLEAYWRKWIRHSEKRMAVSH